MSQVAKTIAKPQLRGHAAAFIRRHLIISISLSVVAGLAYKFLVGEPRKRRYAEFNANYDDDKRNAELYEVNKKYRLMKSFNEIQDREEAGN